MFYSAENNLNASYWDTYIPFVDEQMTSGYLRVPDGVELHYRFYVPQHAIGLVLVMPGRAESTDKYAELLFELYQNDYAVVIYDHRGQGRSTRQCKNPNIGYVTDFEYYVQDASAILDQVIKPLNLHNLPQFLIAHSMGAAIATKLLVLRQQEFSAAALMAPMYGIAAPIPIWLGKTLAWIKIAIEKICRKDASYFIGQGNYFPVAFEKNHLTNSKIRYSKFIETHAKRAELQLGGISPRWLLSAIEGMESIFEAAKTVYIPCSVFLAEKDTVVSKSAIRHVVSAMRNASLYQMHDSQHEILFEIDTERKQAMTSIYALFNKHTLTPVSE